VIGRDQDPSLDVARDKSGPCDRRSPTGLAGALTVLGSGMIVSINSSRGSATTPQTNLRFGRAVAVSTLTVPVVVVGEPNRDDANVEDVG